MPPEEAVFEVELRQAALAHEGTASSARRHRGFGGWRRRMPTTSPHSRRHFALGAPNSSHRPDPVSITEQRVLHRGQGRGLHGRRRARPLPHHQFTTIITNVMLEIGTETGHGWSCQHGASRPPRNQPRRHDLRAALSFCRTVVKKMVCILSRWKERERFVISQECLLFSWFLKGCFLCIWYQHKVAMHASMSKLGPSNHENFVSNLMDVILFPQWLVMNGSNNETREKAQLSIQGTHRGWHQAACALGHATGGRKTRHTHTLTSATRGSIDLPPPPRCAEDGRSLGDSTGCLYLCLAEVVRNGDAAWKPYFSVNADGTYPEVGQETVERMIWDKLGWTY